MGATYNEINKHFPKKLQCCYDTFRKCIPNPKAEGLAKIAGNAGVVGYLLMLKVC